MKAASRLTIFLLIELSILSVIVYAATWEVSIPGHVNVVAIGKLAVYWNSACTQPVITIEFGNQAQGAQPSKFLYIKNEGTVPRALDWYGLGSAGDVHDRWDHHGSEGLWEDLRGHTLAPGDVLETMYELSIPTNATIGSVTWTLQLGYS
jgi:hypothetical protein